MKINRIARTLSSIVIGPEVAFQNLLMLPLIAQQRREGPRSRRGNADAPFSTSQHPSAPLSTLDYLVLDDALASGDVEITEVSEQGSVPDLRVVNRGLKPVLILDGEELVGAKQNRVVNLTILVAAKSVTTIPVSCVEAGRWRARSRAFGSAARTQYATGRAKRMKHVTESLHFRGDRMSDQAAVWADIAQKSARLKASSPTAAMEAIFVDHSSAIERYVAACTPVDHQLGAVFVVSGRTVGFDLFDRESTLRKVLPKLVRSAAVEALDAESGLGEMGTGPLLDPDPARKPPIPASVLRASSEQFLAAVANAPQHLAKAVGLGDDIRLSAQGLVGAGLLVDGVVLHLSAFADAAA